MGLIIAMLFGSLVTTTISGTKSYEDCLSRDFEPSACKTSKTMHDLGPKEKDDTSKKIASN